VRSALFVALVTGVAYPLATTGVAQLLWPETASGSLIRQGGTVIGSRLIGQHFTAGHYFHPRPSATTGPDPADHGRTAGVPYNAAASLGSNQGPTHAALIEAVQQRVRNYRRTNGLAAGAAVPVEAVTASASGLDPHISVANARLQMDRVARARQLPMSEIRSLLARHTEGRWLGLLGEPRINVLLLNLALDARQPPATAASASREGEAHVR